VDVTTVALEGDIDLATVASAREILSNALAASPGTTLLIDMSRVTFLDSTGMGMLVSARHQAIEAAGDLRVMHPARGVQRVLEVTGLDKVLLDADTPSDADLVRRASGQTYKTS
jgi:anti-anti-sigma factor